MNDDFFIFRPNCVCGRQSSSSCSKGNRGVPNATCWGLGGGVIVANQSLSCLQVMALADAVEENQERLLQSSAGLRSATHLLILLVRLWQKLSADQTAILEAAFLPLQEDMQGLVRTHKPRLNRLWFGGDITWLSMFFKASKRLVFLQKCCFPFL